MSYFYSVLLICVCLGIIQDTKSNNKIKQDISTIEEILYFYPAKGEKLLNEFLTTTDKDELEKYHGHLNFLSGVLTYKKGESDSALVYLEKALITFVNDEDKLYQAKAQLILGWLAEKIGYWQQSKINYYKVIELADKDNKREQGLAYLGIARCKHYLLEGKADELDIGTGLLNALGKREYSLYAEFLNLVINNSNEETPGKLLAIAGVYSEMGLPSKAASAFKVLATYYRKRDDWDSAHKYLDKALALDLTSYPSTSLLPSLNQMKGSTYYYQKDYVNAKHYLKISLRLSKEYKQEYLQYYIYKTMSKIDTLLGDYKTGLIHFSKAVASNEFSNQKGEIQLAKLMEVSNNLTLIQEENDSLKSTRYIIILLASSTILLLVIIFVVVYYRQKLKARHKLEKEKEKKQAFHSLLVNLGEKRLLNKTTKEINLAVKKISGEFVERDLSLSNDFEECYYESIKKINSHYPSLTKSDAIYGVMFSLNLSNDIIAEIKNVNPESIRKTKLRIREKLNLDKRCDLEKFFTCSLSKE